MQGEIIIIPTPMSLEMLKDMAQKLAKELVTQGITVVEEISLCPDRKRLQHAISKALERSDLLFTLGGMGRDSQFLAKQVMSEGLGLPLEHSAKSMAAIEQYAFRRGISLSPDDVTLASLPAGSRPLLPTRGILPGCLISSSKQHIVMLPENEQEILPMVSSQVMPVLAKAGLSADSTHWLRTYGVEEAQVRQMLADLMGSGNPVVTTYTQGEDVVVQVAATGPNPGEAAELGAPVLRTIAERLGDYAYGLDVKSLEQAIVSKMKSKNLSVAVAEAGTSGLFSGRFVSELGGQDLLEKQFIVEDNDSKIVTLGLHKKDLRRKGDVSEWAAVAMANGARHEGNTHLGVGICAHVPGFSQAEDGVAFIAICDNDQVYVKKILVEADSITAYDTVVDATVSRALNMLRLFVDYLPDHYHGSISLERALAGKVTVTDKESYAIEDGFDYGDQLEEKPKARKGSGSKLRRIITLIAVAAVLFGAVYLGQYFVKSVIARGLRDDLAVVYASTGIEGLHSLNRDTVGFVQIGDTEMKYPVVKASNNDYYLRRDFNEKSNQHGVPFMDYRANPRKPSENLVIYGHNMRDGQIFGELLKYKEVEYYRQHPVIEYEGLKGKGRYKVFSVFLTSAAPSHFNDGVVFNYPQFVDSSSKEEYNEYIKQVQIRSILNVPVDVEAGDELLTLSTCDYDLMDSRFVVMARKVRGGESDEVDVAAAVLNPTPLYPDVWYQMYGGTKPDSNSWTYAPPSGKAPVDRQPTPSKEEEKEEADKPVQGEESKKEPSTSQQETSAQQAEVQRQAELERQAEEARKAEAAKQAEAGKQAEADKAAKQAEADKAAAEAAEAKKKADEEAAKKAEADKVAAVAAEATAIAEGIKAETAADEAATKQQDTLNASLQSEAKQHAAGARAAADRARTAANAAKAAAATAGTSVAEEAAQRGETAAVNANISANRAAETAKLKEDDSWDQADVVDVQPLRISTSSSYKAGDTLDIVSRVVQNEVGTTFHPEAVKAQAVAAYTFISQANATGSTPSVVLASQADPKIKNLVAQVLGEAVYYNGAYAFTPYHATSAGATTSSAAVWGGSYPYLVSVDSSVDSAARGYESTTTMSASKVSSLLSQKIGVETEGDPSGWFDVVSNEEGGYNGQMTVCGQSRTRNGSRITGRLLRESVLSLRSAAFQVDYNASSDQFTFTTHGYGHGVGMSQTGANQYAQQGWAYVEILEHYYPGTQVS